MHGEAKVKTDLQMYQKKKKKEKEKEKWMKSVVNFEIPAKTCFEMCLISSL